MHIVKFIFLIFVSLNYYVLNAECLHQKDKNITIPSTPQNVSIAYHDQHEHGDENDGNYSQPVLIPIREVIRDPHSLGKREWHWYRWTRTKYLTYKHSKGVRKQNASIPYDTIGNIDEQRIPCRANNESSLDDFPEDLFTQEERLSGAILFHFFGAMYFFTISGIVIDRYFIPSVQCICEDLNITPDVGAAVFMATATATPELFTNLISTFVTDSDMGLGTVIGSLMFNILGVTSLSAILLCSSMKIDWWPLTRDCSMFAFNVIFLLIFAWDGKIYLWEASILLLLILNYYIVMFNSKKLEKIVKHFFPDDLSTCDDYEKESKTTVYTISTKNLKVDTENVHIECNESRVVCKIECSKNPMHLSTDGANKEKTPELCLWSMPETKSPWIKIWWFYSWPIRFILFLTLPNPLKYRKFYPLTFLLCIIWIGLVAYLIFWMLVVIGATFDIQESVLGLTILAIGGCTPEMITGAIMARRGQIGTGIANSLGASSLAILLSLGVPWFIKNVLLLSQSNNPFVEAAQDASVIYTITSLIFVPIALYIIISTFRFEIRRTTSIFLFCSYVTCVAFAILVELDVVFESDNPC